MYFKVKDREQNLRYGVDFDPQTNPTVRVYSRQLRRALEQYYLKIHSPDSSPIRAALGALYVDDYVLFRGPKDLMDSALELVESAYRLDA